MARKKSAEVLHWPLKIEKMHDYLVRMAQEKQNEGTEFLLFTVRNGKSSQSGHYQTPSPEMLEQIRNFWISKQNIMEQ